MCEATILSANQSDGFTLSQLTRLFNKHRRELGIRCKDQADWKQQRNCWTKARYVPSGMFRDEHGTGRAQPVYVPKL